MGHKSSFRNYRLHYLSRGEVKFEAFFFLMMQLKNVAAAAAALDDDDEAADDDDETADEEHLVVHWFRFTCERLREQGENPCD